MIQRWLKPNAAGWILFALLVGVQPILIVRTSAIVQTGTTGDQRSTETWIGLPPLVHVTEAAGDADRAHPVREIEVFWLRVGGVVLVTYLLTMTVGRLVSMSPDGVPVRTGWRHPAAVLGIVILAVALCSLVIAILMSVFAIGANGMSVTPKVSVHFTHWYLNFIGFTLLGLFFVMPITILVMIVRRSRERRRAGLRGFPVDLGSVNSM